MNIPRPQPSSPSRKRSQHGMAVIAVLAILAIVMIYVAGTLGTLRHLGRDLQLIEQRQIRRLKTVRVQGNLTGKPTQGPGLARLGKRSEATQVPGTNLQPPSFQIGRNP